VLLDLKEECQSVEAHEDLQEKTDLVTSAGADLKDSPNFSRPVCDMDLDSKSILGSYMKVVHTCWIVGRIVIWCFLNSLYCRVTRYICFS
jgi:hypothetical protein